MIIFYYPLRFLLRLIRDIDGIFTWATTGWHPAPKIHGQCKKRGICCQNIAVGVSRSLNRRPFLLRWVNIWYQFVYNFKLKGWYKTDAILIYSCNYLKNNHCQIYWRRPLICRQYPHKKRIGQTLLPGCGYILKEPTPIAPFFNRTTNTEPNAR
ncbi:MAG: hypothetical protein ACO3K7_01150 [Candidatus Marinamargulisbacteria bacterium]